MMIHPYFLLSIRQIICRKVICPSPLMKPDDLCIFADITNIEHRTMLHNKIVLTLALGLSSLLGSSLLAQSDIITAGESRYGARIGLCIVRISDGKPLYEHRTHELFTPASTVKVLSTGAALRQCGRSFRFSTDVYAVGKVEAGTLHGSLLISGSGDPSIGSKLIPQDTTRFVRELSQALAARGIRTIEGGLYIDGSLPTPVGVHPSWMEEDIVWPYGAGLYGFNYQDNTLNLTLAVERNGKHSYTKLVPTRETGITVHNDLRVAGGEKVVPELTPLIPELRLKGTLPRATQSLRLQTANPDPARTASLDIQRFLSGNSITLGRTAERSYVGYEREGELLYTYRSLPLDTLCLMTNHRSLNLYAEAIASSLETSGNAGRALESYWRTQTGLGDRAIRIVDGSGLSRSNSLSPEAMTRALLILFGGKEPQDGALVETLPQLGVDGTVRRLMPSDELTAYLKSGTMRGVTCYAGYIFHDGEWYTLTYFANGFPSAAIARETLKTFLRNAFPKATHATL